MVLEGMGRSRGGHRGGGRRRGGGVVYAPAYSYVPSPDTVYIEERPYRGEEEDEDVAGLGALSGTSRGPLLLVAAIAAAAVTHRLGWWR